MVGSPQRVGIRREHAVVALKRNRVLWWRDDLTPHCGSGFCHEVPVVVVVDRKGGFYAFGTANSHTCYGTLFGSLPQRAGERWETVAGDFAPLVERAKTVLLTYSNPYGGQTSTETDTVSKRTHLVESGRDEVAGGGKPSFTVTFRAGYPRHAPAAPRINLCGK